MGFFLPCAAEMPSHLQHKIVELRFAGPWTEEAQATPHPFLDYRFDLLVTTPNGRRVALPGHFAADGRAALTGATAGNQWRAFVVAEEAGEYSWQASYRTGPDIAVSREEGVSAGYFDGQHGCFRVVPRVARGSLRVDEGGVLRWRGTGGPFLKVGVNSPENRFAFAEFDATQDLGGQVHGFLHHFASHEADWRPGDPHFGGGRGRAIFGANRWLAERGVNCQFAVLWTRHGDGDDCRHHASPNDWTRFDVSKLDQWGTVVGHFAQLGGAWHLAFWERENDSLMTEREWRLHLREVVSRLPGPVIWCLGEETTLSGRELRRRAEWLRMLAPDAPVSLHTLPWEKERHYAPLIGSGLVDVLSLQVDDVRDSKWESHYWRQRAPWAVAVDEIGPPHLGVPEDSHPGGNTQGLRLWWGSVTSGGYGGELYGGYETSLSDLTLEDYRPWEGLLWSLKAARDFLEREAIALDQLDSPEPGLLVARDRMALLWKPRGEPWPDLRAFPRWHRVIVPAADAHHARILRHNELLPDLAEDWVLWLIAPPEARLRRLLGIGVLPLGEGETRTLDVSTMVEASGE